MTQTAAPALLQTITLKHELRSPKKSFYRNPPPGHGIRIADIAFTKTFFFEVQKGRHPFEVTSVDDLLTDGMDKITFNLAPDVIVQTGHNWKTRSEPQGYDCIPAFRDYRWLPLTSAHLCLLLPKGLHEGDMENGFVWNSGGLILLWQESKSGNLWIKYEK